MNEANFNVGTNFDERYVYINMQMSGGSIEFKLSPYRALFLAQLLIEKSLNITEET